MVNKLFDDDPTRITFGISTSISVSLILILIELSAVHPFLSVIIKLKIPENSPLIVTENNLPFIT